MSAFFDRDTVALPGIAKYFRVSRCCCMSYHACYATTRCKAHHVWEGGWAGRGVR